MRFHFSLSLLSRHQRLWFNCLCTHLPLINFVSFLTQSLPKIICMKWSVYGASCVCPPMIDLRKEEEPYHIHHLCSYQRKVSLWLHRCQLSNKVQSVKTRVCTDLEKEKFGGGFCFLYDKTARRLHILCIHSRLTNSLENIPSLGSVFTHSLTTFRWGLVCLTVLHCIVPMSSLFLFFLIQT